MRKPNLRMAREIYTKGYVLTRNTSTMKIKKTGWFIVFRQKC